MSSANCAIYHKKDTFEALDRAGCNPTEEPNLGSFSIAQYLTFHLASPMNRQTRECERRLPGLLYRLVASVGECFLKSTNHIRLSASDPAQFVSQVSLLRGSIRGETWAGQRSFVIVGFKDRNSFGFTFTGFRESDISYRLPFLKISRPGRVQCEFDQERYS